MPPVMYPTPKDHMFALPPLLPTKEDRLTEAQIRHKEEIYVQGLQFVEWMRVGSQNVESLIYTL